MRLVVSEAYARVAFGAERFCSPCVSQLPVS